MPSFNPINLTLQDNHDSTSPQQDTLGPEWIPVLKHSCEFGQVAFLDVLLNHLRNPNINSSHLFRADILFDSQNDELTNEELDKDETSILGKPLSLKPEDFPGFTVQRSLVRKLIPRNPQLDRPIAQTCHLLVSKPSDGSKRNLVVCYPHVRGPEELPWYHPTVKALAYLHHQVSGDSAAASTENGTTISLHYQLFPDQDRLLPDRSIRTAHNLLGTLYKHGQGSLSGYTKKGLHDQIISQQRVQDTYSQLKQRFAKRLCENWVEQTEPTKHVFEDLGIAAFLVELWKDMYQPPSGPPHAQVEPGTSTLPPFPGFVDIGCGNGVLTEVLLLSGFPGWGLDARKRKTWSVLSTSTQLKLSELLLVPQPLFDLEATSHHPSGKVIDRVLSFLSPNSSSLRPPSKPWHNGIFPKGTFLISNHSDELTAWTPLLASLSRSPFLAIPCCSHNLSGARFRAPSIANSHTADASAPSFFAAQKPKTRPKSIPLGVMIPADMDEDTPILTPTGTDNSASPPAQATATTEISLTTSSKPETGDLKSLSPSARAKQPSAYASLCEWVIHLSKEVQYNVEKEMLRIPSTRNVGIVGRTWKDGKENESTEERRKRVLEIARREGADGKAYVQRCEGVLAKDGYKGHG